MTAETAVLPSPAVPIVKEDGRVDDTWYQRLRSLASATNTANTAPPSASAKTGDYTAVSDDRAAFITMTGASTLSLDAAATLGDTWWIAFANIGSRRITINPDGAELIDAAATIYLYPGQGCLIFCTGAAFYTIGKPARWKPAGQPTIYVATTGSDSADGLDVAAPMLTIQTAINFILFEVDTQNTTGLVQLADGTYDQRFQVVADGLGSNQVEIRGHVGSDTAVVIQPTSGTDPVIYVKDKGIATVTYMTIASSTAAVLAQSEQYAVLDISLVIFGQTASVHCKAIGHGRINLLEDYQIQAGAAAHLQSDRGGIIEVANAVVTITGVLAYTYFALASELSDIHCTNSTFSGGTVTGQRYLSQLNSVINTEGGGANFFPGNAPGATATGGQYV